MFYLIPDGFPKAEVPGSNPGAPTVFTTADPTWSAVSLLEVFLPSQTKIFRAASWLPGL